jgi:hypothetical protein
MPDFAAMGGIVGVTVGTICCGDTRLGDDVGMGVAAGLQLANSSIISKLTDRKSRFELGTFT